MVHAATAAGLKMLARRRRQKAHGVGLDKFTNFPKSIFRSSFVTC
jgi:hypothetical protein